MFKEMSPSTLLLIVYLIVATFQPVVALPVRNAVKKFQSKFECEDGILRIGCSHSSVLEISNADFGRRLENVCPVRNSTKSCNKMYNHDKLLKKNCNGRQVCSIYTSAEVFGDPCPGVKKYMEVIYACVRNPDWLTTTTSTESEWPSSPISTPSVGQSSQKQNTLSNITAITYPTASSSNSSNSTAATSMVLARKKTRDPRKCTTGPTVIVFVPDPLEANGAVSQYQACSTSVLFVLVAKLVLEV